MWAYSSCFVFRSASQPNAIHFWKKCFGSLVMPAVHFSSLQGGAPTITADVYRGALLASLTPKMRGEVLATVARNVMKDLGSECAVADAMPGQCVDGRQRSQSQAEYDWLYNGRRVECKSSQIRFIVGKSLWYFRFSGVKLAIQGQRATDAFDDLLLVLYTPRRLHVYRHDLTTGVYSAGKVTHSRGYIVQIGSAKALNWLDGLESILAKLDAGSNRCERIIDIPLDDHRVKDACLRHRVHAMQDIYENVPLANLNPPSRGLVLQRLAQEIDAIISPDGIFFQQVLGC